MTTLRHNHTVRRGGELFPVVLPFAFNAWLSLACSSSGSMSPTLFPRRTTHHTWRRVINHIRGDHPHGGKVVVKHVQPPLGLPILQSVSECLGPQESP